MNLNSVQKIIFLLFILCITYIFIFYIPFIDSYGKIEYGGIFSNNKKIDYQRLLLVLFFISFIATSFIIIFKKENLYFILTKWKIISISLFVFSLIFAMFIYGTNNKTEVNPIQTETADTASVVVDSAYAEPYVDTNCNTEVALSAFKKEMNFTYPDWKINGEPVIEEISSCTFNIRFTSYNPHMSEVGVLQKEVHIAQITISGDSYYFKQIRGTLY
jgi:hypothetical protein